jgi:hypothetical protein
VRSHAKASTAGSTQRQAAGLGRTRFAQTAVLAFAIASLLAFAATPASASLLRNHEASFGSFTNEDPQALTVDQSNGDVYAVDTTADKVLRFDSSGLPHNFSAGPNAGTNSLTGFSFESFSSLIELAVDNSGGPSEGNLYVTNHQVKIFASSGEPLGTLTGTGTPGGSFGEICGVAVDQANGDVYLADFLGKVWRYSPSGATVAESDYSGAIAVPYSPCQLAVAKGSVYVHSFQEFAPGPLNKYATSDFALGSPPEPSSTTIASANAVATDPSNGDVYVDEGGKVTVFSSAGGQKYSFGGGDFGSFSAGVAVRAGGAAYVSDPSAHEIDAYGTTLEPGNRAHLFAFGSFTNEDPQALTVDQSNGDLYVVAANEDRVLRFNSSGLPHDFSAGPDAGTNTLSGFSFEPFPSLIEVAVDNSGGPSEGNLYVARNNVKVFAQSGEPLGSLSGTGTPGGAFGEICGVAVDQANGDVYLADFLGKVWRYSPSGATVAESDYSGAIAVPYSPCQLAVAQGSVYVHSYQEFAPGPLNKYATSDFALGSPPEPSSDIIASANAVATDPSNGDVYVDEGAKVTVFSSAGAQRYSFGAGEIGSFSAGVAVRAGGNAYASDSSAHEIDAYGPFSAPPPLVSTNPATSVNHTRATLRGHLDPNGSLPIAECKFEWGTSTSYGEAPIPCAEGSSFSAAADVSAELTGLTPGTTYHFRLHVLTGGGSFNGEDKSFEAIPPSSVPEASTGKSSILSSTSSLLKGTVNPNANPLTGCRFEYVDDIGFQETGFADLSSGGSLPCDQAPGSIPADFEDHEVTATASGLDPERVYRFRVVAENANGPGASAPALVPGPPLVETTGSTWRTATTARLDSRVSPHGAETTYRFEYVTDAQFQAGGFAGAASTPETALTTNEAQRVVVSGEPGEQFKLSFGGYTTPDIELPVTAEEVQAALRALPSIGSPNVRVDFEEFEGQHEGGAYTVTFQGALGNVDVEQLKASPGTVPVFTSSLLARTAVPGGPDDRTSLVSAPLAGLQPATTYRYRVIAENGTPGGPATGEEMAIATRPSDAPLTHGHFPGPPGSDRAWEQVSFPDTGGNGVRQALAIADNGDSAIYAVEGGTPVSEVGSSLFGADQLYAERTASGWRFNQIFPPRTQARGNQWLRPVGRGDLSRLFAGNFDLSGAGTFSAWRLSPGAPAQLVYDFPSAGSQPNVAASADGSRVVASAPGDLDPGQPLGVGNVPNLYDITSGTPRLIGFLPDGSVPSCGVRELVNVSQPPRINRVSADGSHVFFLSSGSFCGDQASLYVRDLEAETTTLIAPAAVFIHSTPGAAFFWTKKSFLPEDTGGGDIYRYDVGEDSSDCLTCFDLETDVSEDPGANNIAVSGDGSRVYFMSKRRLLPGAASVGLYRVDVAAGELAYVAPLEGPDQTGENFQEGNAISADGTFFVFHSSSPALNSLGGPQNRGTKQYYLYDDRDRSLACVSCPADGGAPRDAVPGPLSQHQPLSDSGDLVFGTATALVSADQNTAGPGQAPNVGRDIYEWRDGRPLLVTDGLAANRVQPEVVGITPSGRDAFFTQGARLTPDSIDSYPHLYDARIGGGFEFPAPPPPCPLEACQGTPRGVPEESRPGSADYAGAGNVSSRPARCRKGKVRRRGRCVAKKHKRAKKRSQHRANHDRRASR